MNKLPIAASAALTISAMLASTSAFAAVDPLYGTDPALDQQCSDLQRPNANSGYTSFAAGIQVTNSSSVTEDVGILSTVGIGTPVTAYSNFSGAHVNGQSVNIHAFADKTVSYPGGATVTYETKTTITETRSGKCHVHKPTEGQNQDDPDHAGYQVAPRGLQTPEPVTATSIVITFGTRTATLPGPWIDPNATVLGSQVVICNSPGRNPGTWRNQNGYMGNLGTCSRAWYDSLGSTPSVSVPTN